MSNLAIDTRGSSSEECSSTDAVAVASELPAEPKVGRIPVALSWIIIAGVSAGLWIAVADLGHWLLP